MTNPTELDLVLLDRFLAGECIPSERVRVERLLAEDAQWRDQAAALQAALRAAANPIHPDDIVRAALGRAEPTLGRPRVPRDLPWISRMPRSTRWWNGARVFGVGVVVAAVVGAVFIARSAPRAPEWQAGRVYTTVAGQRARIVLPDGSVATLAPRTTLVLANAFGRETRTLRLVGHAYFEVGHPPGNATPFIVRTGTVETRVLGTTFDVQRYPADSATRVVVIEGRVSSGGWTHVTIPAGSRGTITDSAATAVPIDRASQYAAWVDGRLQFDNAPLPDVLDALGNWYGIRLRLADSTLVRRHLTAEFNGGSQGEMLTSLASLLDVTATLTRDPSGVTIITLHGRRAGGRPSATERERNRGVGAQAHAQMEVGR